jgi:predicted Rossmann fold flavoprotein
MDGTTETGAMHQPRVLIIGGGAAGLSAAIAAARAGAGVSILESGSRIGRKILASGNGRCNLSNVSISPSAYNHPAFVEPVIGVYPYEPIKSFFADMGLLVRVDDEGRVYPSTNAAASVLDVMRLECARLGVEISYDFEVDDVRAAPGGGFAVSSADGERVCGQSVIVATGGGSLLKKAGHRVLNGVPVLGPLKTETGPIRGLSGIRVRCAATLLAGANRDSSGGTPVATERGELLFRDYGVSGIMIFDLSRYLEKKSVISIDFFPDIAETELQAMLAMRRDSLSWRSADTFFTGMLHDRVARAVLRAAQVSSSATVKELPLDVLAVLLKDFRLKITGRGDAAQAQVTRGGASVAEFDANTMESNLTPGLFAAGEVLDIDGRSGGFNLHWAWASGIVAGQAAARSAMALGAPDDLRGVE